VRAACHHRSDTGGAASGREQTPQATPAQAAPGGAGVAMVDAQEDEMMADFAAAAACAAPGSDGVPNLEATLRPVEKYAVRFLEEVWGLPPPPQRNRGHLRVAFQGVAAVGFGSTF
jgi:hypothetical protein